jgi:predicted amidophosphoribosyltransferase
MPNFTFDVERLARNRACPRCDLEKTIGAALCSRCRSKLPQHMRRGLEAVADYDQFFVKRALRAAADYFNLHFQSIRKFGGGKRS